MYKRQLYSRSTMPSGAERQKTKQGRNHADSAKTNWPVLYTHHSHPKFIHLDTKRTMNITLHKQFVRGTLAAIPSKSIAHRLLICAALCQSPTEIECAGSSADIEATLNCLRAVSYTHLDVYKRQHIMSADFIVAPLIFFFPRQNRGIFT